MSINIGYACQVVGIPDATFRTCLAKKATPEVLADLIAHNLQLLERIVDYNRDNGIRLFRISSDLIPFGSSPVNTLAWWDLFAPQLALIGAKIRTANLRVSMHPGQYTVLNSPDPDVANRAAADLVYHNRVLDSLGAGRDSKIILHIGGRYGDKDLAVDRFRRNWQQLDAAIRRRLVIENDDQSYTIADVLAIGTALGIPVVFDNLHHELNRPVEDRAEIEWIKACQPLWLPDDGRQKIHYSQQDPGKKDGSHSRTIAPATFLEFCRSLGRDDLDIMLEVKDKNLSARKCLLCCPAAVRSGKAGVLELEREWHHYKYTVLEHSPSDYLAIRELLKDKTRPLAIPFFEHIDHALATDLTAGNAENAALHVWGYFRKAASEEEKQTVPPSTGSLPPRHTVDPADQGAALAPDSQISTRISVGFILFRFIRVRDWFPHITVRLLYAIKEL
jgi:UV DNA damage endonuclease